MKEWYHYIHLEKQGDLYIHENLFDTNLGPDGTEWDFNRWIKSSIMKGTTNEGLKECVVIVILILIGCIKSKEMSLGDQLRQWIFRKKLFKKSYRILNQVDCFNQSNNRW